MTLMERPKVLIIEDDRFLTPALEFYLDEENIHSDVTHSAMEALDIIAIAEQYNAIILDIMMERPKNKTPEEIGGETGTYLYREIRKISKDIPIIILSILPKDRIDIDFSKSNVLYVPKPIESEAEELIRKVKDSIGV